MAETVGATGSAKVGMNPAALPRSMGLLTTFVFAVACTSLVSSGLTPFSVIAGRFPGVPLLGIIAAAALVCLLNAYVYAVIGSAVRRSGADYILASRVFHPVIGFAFSWTMVLYSGFVLGKIIAQVGQSILPVFLRSISMIFSAPSMILTAETVASPQGVSIAGSIIVLTIFVLCILPPKVNHQVMLVGFVLMLAGWAVVFIQLLFPASSFPAAWERFMGAGTYVAQVQIAQDAGMVSSSAEQAFWGIGLLVAYWLYFGFQSPAYIAGEVKTPGRTLILSSVGAVGLTFLLVGLGIILTFRWVPQEWLSAQSYLYLTGKQAMPWLNFYAALLQPNPILISFLTFAWVASFLIVVQAYFTFCSRIILAWGEDGLMPRMVNYVHPRLKSPIIAVLMIAILAQMGLVFVAVNQSTISVDFGLIVFAIVAQALPVLAALWVPFQKKAWFAAAGHLVGLKIGPLPVISFASLALLGYFVWLLGMIMGTPGLFSQAIVSIAVLGFLLVTGGIYFYVRRWYLRKEEIDLMLAFQSFPEVHD